MTTNAFDRLHKKIQHVLWDMNWTELRPIQFEAIHYLNDEPGDLVIAANTASGKTEAAFLPVLSHIADDSKDSVKALYVGPLKALINDQFRRLEDLCSKAEIPVHRWHGDVSASAKRKLVQKPSGVLLITPESIESLFINRSAHLQKLFKGLEFVVIDEIHTFIGTERGVHLISLLSRLQEFSQIVPRRIGLSATLGDMNAACNWISATPDRNTHLIKSESDSDLAVIIKGYLSRSPLKKTQQSVEDDNLDDLVTIASDIFEAFRGKTNLVFGNAKARLELFTDLLARISKDNGFPNEFLIHHGSLAKNIREETEKLMQSGKHFTTFCTNTLELGIDIGYVDSIGQIDPPFSVSSLTQRIGRSGRKENTTATLRFFIQEAEPDERSPIWHTLYSDLLQAIAMIELRLEKWCETPRSDRLHYSTLVQQILSVLSQTGGVNAGKLYNILIQSSAFSWLSVDEYKVLLRGIAKHDFIEQMPQNDLILGIAGQRIVNHYDFYSAFHSPEEYRVINNNGKPVGALPLAYPIPVGEHVILAGIRWQVINIDDDKKEIIVAKAHGAKPPLFLPGHSDISFEIRKKMHEMLFAKSIPAYLDPTARKMLLQSRKTASQLQLNHHQFHQVGPDTVLFTWTSSVINTTLRLACEAQQIRATDFGLGLVFEKKEIEDVKCYLRKISEQGIEQLSIAQKLDRDLKLFDKYDKFLPDKLLDKAYVGNRLDIPGANLLISELIVTNHQKQSINP